MKVELNWNYKLTGMELTGMECITIMPDIYIHVIT